MCINFERKMLISTTLGEGYTLRVTSQMLTFLKLLMFPQLNDILLKNRTVGGGRFYSSRNQCYSHLSKPYLFTSSIRSTRLSDCALNQTNVRFTNSNYVANVDSVNIAYVSLWPRSYRPQQTRTPRKQTVKQQLPRSYFFSGAQLIACWKGLT